MRQVIYAILTGLVLWAQQRADLAILVETSQLTCGKPLQNAQQALRALCQQGQGSISLSTFSRLQGGTAITPLTTPIQDLSDEIACTGLIERIRPRCDSVYMVNLLHAVEEVINKGYSANILVLCSGKETGRGLTVGEVRNLAKKKGVKIYVASIGWLANEDATQGFLKQLSGVLEGEEGTFIVADPAAPQSATILSNFVRRVWQRSRGSGGSGDESSPSQINKGAVDTPPAPATPESPSIPPWVWIALAGAGVVVLIVLLIVLLRPKPAPTPPPPPVVQAPAPMQTSAAPPPPVAPPAPVLRRLIIYYPHTQQDVNLSPSTAPITLGRAPDNTIVIADNTVSSRHARLFLQGNQWYVQDLGSTNGTFVNEQRVSQHPVRVGDRIRLGAIVIQIAG